MNSNSRSNILAKLRKGARQIPPAPQPAPSVPARTPQAMRECFCQMMTAVHGEVHSTTGKDWPKLFFELLQEKNIQSLLVAPDTPIGKTVIQRCPEDYKLVYANQPIENYKDELFYQTEASITGCRCAIAETGTLILWPSREEPRSMSLVPPIHFVLLDSSRLRNTFDEVIEAEHWQDKMPANALLISGPSKTADIQQTLAYGAHGPKELIILMI